MKIGIYTYGTRGDLQPYIALALGLLARGHQVTISATEDFKEFVEGFAIPFEPLYGNAEGMMNSSEGQAIVKAQNPLKMMQYYFKVIHDTREPLRKSYYQAISKVDVIIANTMTLPIVSAIAEKQQKKMALTYFMPPIVPTTEFPLADFDFLNLPWYNKLTYQIARYFFWQVVKKDVNEYRQELGLKPLTQNVLTYLDQQEVLDLYCLSPSLIAQPTDWEKHHKITGFLTVPAQRRASHFLDRIPPALQAWLANGEKPIYIEFGSSGISDPEQFACILSAILEQTTERVLFCTGWSLFAHLPDHANLFVTKYVNHEVILPQCKLGVFHGGAGTLATLLRHDLPVILISFYTDQPTWGKLVEKRKLGVHIPLKRLTAAKLISAIEAVQVEKVQENVRSVGHMLRNENGIDTTISELEHYFVTHS